MTNSMDALVIGGGIGGLCAAILLGASGLRVHLLERAESIGGKAGTSDVDGVEVDTGPSVLTLPHVFDDIFAQAGLEREQEIELTAPVPGFRYHYQDGVTLDVHHRLGDTLDSVRATLGSRASLELESYLKYAEKIWEAAAPHFVFSSAPELPRLLFGGASQWGALAKVDPLRALSSAIDRKVKSEHLRMLLRRYATYNGSDARSAPATLGCIAHVELALGGYGVRGGMIELVRALGRAATAVGVQIHLGAEVKTITSKQGQVSGVILRSGERLQSSFVVANADASHLTEDLLEGPSPSVTASDFSMSAHTGIIRAGRTTPSRPAHAVLFPTNYTEEFADIFDRRRVPLDPTIYLCAQEACHGRPGWADEEPVFCMVNAPALVSGVEDEAVNVVQERVRTRLLRHSLIAEDDSFAWWRTPAELAARFPGSRGSLYGAASNTSTAAFRRPKNRSPLLGGLYLASGSAHPGGGVPMVALSGKQAARALLQDRRAAA